MTLPRADAWPAAARALAVRATRRARASAFLRRAGAGLGGGAAAALVARLLGVGPAALAPAAVAVGALAGALAGAGAARRVPATRPADAAWALDRLAGAHGAGLAAAVTQGPDRKSVV